MTFDGFAKGTYSDHQMPAFNVNLKVNNAMFKYPDLPTSINNINMDLLIDNKDGVIQNTLIDLKKLHLDFGSTPLDARLLIANLKDYRMDAAVKAKLNLEELTRMFPMEGLQLKGIYGVDAVAKGTYDSIRKTIPQVDASMTLTNGYVKSTQLPAPLEDLKMDVNIKNTTGKMAETVIAVNNFSMLLEGEKLSASLLLKDLNDYTWDLKANGGVDLEKMTRIFPLEGMTLSGKVKANIVTKGKMSDVNAKRFDKLPTSGSASLRDFKYTAKGMPAVTISQADASFDPRKIDLSKLEGTVGKSDYKVTGQVMNYMGYVLSNETIKGTVTFNSNFMDLNEFMTEEPAPATTDTASFGVIPIPKNIDFSLKSSLQTVKMMDYTIMQANGDIILKDGVANLSGLKFNMLGGAFVMNGTYNTKDVHHPRYDFDLKVDHLSIQQAANSISIIKTYAPFAGLINGNFSTDFKINGGLKKNMMPDMATLNGGGLIKIAEAVMTQSSLMSGISSLTKLDNTGKVTLKDVLMSASINNGRLSVKPFDVKFGNYPTTVSGSTGLDGSIDYSLKMMVPAGQVGAQLQGLLNQYSGTSKPTDKIPVTIGLGGTYKDPKTKLLTSDQKNQATQAVTNAAKEKGTEAVDQITKGAKPEDVVKDLLGGTPKKDTTKKDSVKKADPANQLLQNKLQNLLKKKKDN